MAQIIALIGATIAFISLIILGPENKFSKSLFPIGIIISILALAWQKEWISVAVYFLFYGLLYFRFFKNTKTTK